jgi:hypothetical protein
MRLPKALAVVATTIIAVVVVFALTRCSDVPELVLRASIDPFRVEPVTEEVTVLDVQQELLDSLSDFDVREGWLYDPAQTVMKVAIAAEADPIIIADEMADFMTTVLGIQPAFSKNLEGGIPRALAIADDLFAASRSIRDKSCSETGFETNSDEVQRVTEYLLLVTAHRESRLVKRTELGFIESKNGKVTNCRWCRGSRGEQGMFQFMPKGWAQTFIPDGCSPFDRRCAAVGAAKALAYNRCQCIAEHGDRCSTDQYMSAYVMGQVPTPAGARHFRGAAKARRFLCEVRSDCDELWLRDHDDDFALAL